MCQGGGKDRIVITINQMMSQGGGKDRIVITINQMMSLVPDSSPGLL
jgi:hypothetical protein